MSPRVVKRRRHDSESRFRNAKPVHGQVLRVAIHKIAPSPENSLLYRPVKPDDEATVALADSIGCTESWNHSSLAPTDSSSAAIEGTWRPASRASNTYPAGQLPFGVATVKRRMTYS